MIILILIAFAVLFFMFNVLPITKSNHLWSLLFLAGFILSGAAIIANDVNHFGMQVQSQTKTYHLASDSDKMGVLLYKALGNGQEKIYVYKTSAKQAKPKPTKTSDFSAKVTRTKEDSYLKVTTKRYVYTNKLSKLLFGVFGNNREVKHRYYHFYVNKDWYVLSTDQAARLSKLLKTKQTEMKTKIASLVKAKVTQEIMANPSLAADSSKQQALTEAATKVATKQVLDQYVAQVK